MHSFSRRFCELTFFRRSAAIISGGLVCGTLAFCAEIHDAARDGYLLNVKALLKDNPSLVFSKDDLGNTPLHWATNTGHRDVAEFLISSKAPIDGRNLKDMTPLHYAALDGHKNVVEPLLANKAEVNARCTGGFTPLHLAADI